MIWPALAGGAVALGIVWGAYELGHRAGGNACEAATARDDRVAAVAADAAASAAAQAIAGIKVRNTTIQGEVRREIVDRPVYRDCLHSPEQLQRINEAITGRAQPPGGGVVP